MISLMKAAEAVKGFGAFFAKYTLILMPVK